jgi:hypothetical protein
MKVGYLLHTWWTLLKVNNIKTCLKIERNSFLLKRRIQYRTEKNLVLNQQFIVSRISKNKNLLGRIYNLKQT